MIRYYKEENINQREKLIIESEILSAGFVLQDVEAEVCFYIQYNGDSLGDDQAEEKLLWVLQTPFQRKILKNSHFKEKPNQLLIEIGPRLNFSTPFSTNAVSICHNIGLINIERIEYSKRYCLTIQVAPKGGGGDSLTVIPNDVENKLVNRLHDRMTQCRYLKPIESFSLEVKPDSVFEIDVSSQGESALENVNTELGLAFDAWDIQYYTNLFKKKVRRNPTNVECFDLAQSNSEHSRHWFFKGKMIVDGQAEDKSLFQMVMATQEKSNQNNVIKFSDNSSAIKGYCVDLLLPGNPLESSPLTTIDAKRHIIFTAETHNFPTGVAPFPGAATGTGGRIRDVQAAGRGSHVVAGTAGYTFGNLRIPGYDLPWEDKSAKYPPNFASAQNIAVGASNGASDYGNKFGEPVITGFSRSFGLTTPSGERREWIKPIMFSGGIGTLDDLFCEKMTPRKGMEIAKVGGPVYRIGVGGGSASSVEVQGDNQVELDYGAVQRGDPEMEQKLNRVIRACLEMREKNPICSIHDQGAGGNGNVLKEICDPCGALIKASKFNLGDPTLSILEIWGAEYQESNAILINEEDVPVLQKLSQREKCAVDCVGKVTGTGKIQFEDDLHSNQENGEPSPKMQKKSISYPVDLKLDHVLGKMPQKEFNLKRSPVTLKPFKLPDDLDVKSALDRVLRLPSVASKRYLTNKVDRSVTGLIAQQQCVGPLHTPLSDVAVMALSYFSIVGSATSIGEQPIKGLVNPGCGARMTVGEALTNLVFAYISDLKDVKCSANWMWPAKLPGEGAALVDACKAMCEVMKQLGIAVDGGKDSLSMAARVGKDTVKTPGTLVVSAYAPCPNICLTVTPDIKCPDGKGILLYVGMTPLTLHRLGGSALAQCYSQLGDEAPDLDDPNLFQKVFRITQKLISKRLVESGHDVSDGGLITCILEMAFAGNCGINISILHAPKEEPLTVLFAEELGIVIEVSKENEQSVKDMYESEGIEIHTIGYSTQEKEVVICHNEKEVLNESMTDLRDIWEATSFQLENFQTNPDCVQQEAEGLKKRMSPPFCQNFQLDSEIPAIVEENAPKVAVIREEGSNGDREMAAAFYMAGFQVWDVNMHDLNTKAVQLDQFRGLAFVGGFSYADVCGSAKGWAAALKFDADIKTQLDDFYKREDTFTFGVCNGCQLMALLGWVVPDGDDESEKNQGLYLDHNVSGRYESRFASVKIEQSQSIMLQGMTESILGVWIAHGEGRMQFKNEKIMQQINENGCVALRYVDDSGAATTTYPLNPNGSIEGIAGVCSADGRHLAVMPHPERCFLTWQWPWMPQEWRGNKKGNLLSPWMKMFTNAYKWCTESDTT